MATSSLESSKTEILLGLNSFNKPGEVIGKNAWIKLITYLMYTKKGTYPSVPPMGIGIQQYDYEFMDKAISTLQTDIMEQVSTYLPSVPLQSVNVESIDIDSRKVLLITLTFIDNGTTDTAVIAAEAASNIINFEVSIWIFFYACSRPTAVF